MGGNYLDEFLESIGKLPAEVRENFATMRQLDVRAEEVKERIERNLKQYLSQSSSHHSSKKKGGSSSSHPESLSELAKRIREDQSLGLELSDDKITVATKIYEVVDKHIRRLDEDLTNFEAELKSSGDRPHKKQRLGDGAARPGQKGRDLKKATAGAGSGRKKAVTGIDGRYSRTDSLELPVDPNEPKYCTCKNVSFGEMIACDNANCKIEWFHFECVGLSVNNRPKGKWLCPECRSQKRQGVL